MDSHQIWSPSTLGSLNASLGVSWGPREYTMIFFLVSKGEHDNQAVDKTFETCEGAPVFTYADALPYDWKQRGVTIGIVGWTTANDGKASWGDAEKMLQRFADLGGPNLVAQAQRCHLDMTAAKHLCKTIRTMDEANTARFTRAQLEDITSPGGYLFEAVRAIRAQEIPVTPLLVSAIFDTLLNFGIGGRYCPLAWLSKHARTGSKTKTLRGFLRWKATVGSKNNHNSCKHNAQCRSKMFRRLLREKQWYLDQTACEQAVQWTMK